MNEGAEQRSSTPSGHEPVSYRLVSGLFLRLLAGVYLIAFVSIGVQIDGLAGPEGVLPYGVYLGNTLAADGWDAYWMNPTLFWISADTWALEGAAVLGVLFSVALFVDLWPQTSSAALFILYLSFVGAGSVFMNFQWDALLLEMGFLAIFVPGGSRVVVFLYRWLLFRLRFLSGLFKILSGDPYWLGLPALVGGGSWQGLTALHYYFETQPLPHAGARYAHHLPDWILTAGVVAVLVLELIAPLMMFMRRRFRLFAAWATIAFQVTVMLTSNHNFFNVLTLVLCLFLFDDQALSRIIPKTARNWLTRRFPAGEKGGLRLVLARVAAFVIVPVSVVLPVQLLAPQLFPDTLARFLDIVKGYHLVHPYHVFPVMNRERIEVVIEGSQDTIEWREYRFRFKPDRPDKPLSIVQPHHPRLDWMLWFVPSGRPEHQFWISGLVKSLTEGSEPVLDLLAKNPFPEAPPKFIRLSYFHYRFTTTEERATSGAWWVRTYARPVTPFPWFTRPDP